MKQTKNDITANELMDILSDSLRSLSNMDLNDRNIGKCIAKSKEIGNLAGKAIQLSAYALEKEKAGRFNENMLPAKKNISLSSEKTDKTKIIKKVTGTKAK